MILRTPHSGDRVSAAGTLAFALACVAALASGGSALSAAEYCVACSGPDARYRCSMDAAGLAGDTGAQLACIQDIARRAGHAACAVDRTPATSCEGTPWTVAGFPGSNAGENAAIIPRVREASPGARQPPPAGGVPARGDLSPTAAPSDTVYRPQPAGPAATPPSAEPPRPAPKTAVPAEPGAPAAGGVPTKRSALEKAGDAVGSVARKSWSCVSSLFSDC